MVALVAANIYTTRALHASSHTIHPIEPIHIIEATQCRRMWLILDHKARQRRGRADENTAFNQCPSSCGLSPFIYAFPTLRTFQLDG
jgi:hypothetical protein